VQILQISGCEFVFIDHYTIFSKKMQISLDNFRSFDIMITRERKKYGFTALREV